MLTFIPIGLLLFSALGTALLQRLKPSIGYSWLLGSSTSLAAFGVIFYLRWKLPQQVVISNWLPFTPFTDSPILGLDGVSWPYSFCLAAVMAAVMLTGSARLSYQRNPWAWAGAQLVTVLGLLAVYSANLLTVALAWTAIDLVDILILSSFSENRTLGIQAVIAFASRITGVLLVILAMLVNRSQGLAPTFSTLPPLSALFLLLAAGLRLGVLPLNVPMLPDLRVRRGLGMVLRVVSSAASLIVLARIPAQSFSPVLKTILLAFTAVGVVYAAANWWAARNTIAARPHWSIATAGMVLFCVLQGNPLESTAWGVQLLLGGSLIFLYSARSKGSLTFPILGLLGLSALPFTPAASGWAGVFTAPFNFWQAVILAGHLMLLLGYLRHALRPGDALRDMERWVQTAYPLGLIILIISQWVVGLIGWSGSFTIGTWWAALASGLGLAIAGTAGSWAARRGGEGAASAAPIHFYRVTARSIGVFFSTLLSLNWLYRLLWMIYRRLEQGVQLLTNLLEGDGGILWVLVMLALFISIVQNRMGQ